MTDTKKQPGRPRVYETDSGRVGAFRSRQGEAGYLRREVLTTRTTADRLAELAKQEGVPVLDVASALLEYGLAQYDRLAEGTAFPAFPAFPALSAESAQGASTSPGGVHLLRAQASLAHERHSLTGARASQGFTASASLASDPLTAAADDAAAAAVDSNPITNFFARRKETLNGK